MDDELATDHDESERIGQVARVEAPGVWIGRPDPALEAGPVAFFEQRPGSERVQPPITRATLSRRQLWVQPLGDGGVHVKNTGKRELWHAGKLVDECEARPGDTLYVQDVMLLLVERGPLRPQPLSYHAAAEFAFGVADAHGMVGESPAAWALRDLLAAAALADSHVLIRGETGVGAWQAFRPGRLRRRAGRPA